MLNWKKKHENYFVNNKCPSSELRGSCAAAVVFVSHPSRSSCLLTYQHFLDFKSWFLDFYLGMNTDSRFWGFCTVCKISLPTTFRELLWIPSSMVTERKWAADWDAVEWVWAESAVCSRRLAKVVRRATGPTRGWLMQCGRGGNLWMSWRICLKTKPNLCFSRSLRN